MHDVAVRAGVSRQLVSLVMRNRPGPSDASREKVTQVAAELGFHPHASARLLRQNRTMLIGVCFVMQNAFQNDCVEQLFPSLRRHGFHLALGPVTRDRNTEHVIAELMEQRVEALVAFNPDPASAALAAAVERIPVVWLGERDPVGRCDNVHVDEQQGLEQVITHLVELGHRRISYAGGEQGVAGPDRAAAYVSAMRAAGLGDQVDVLLGGFDDADGARAAAAVLGRPGPRPTALVCCSDQSAAAAVTTFARHGLSVPDDISVVGFDDGRVAALPHHDLTSVRQDVSANVDATTEILLARLAGDASARRVLRTPTSLTLRSSVAAPAGGG